MFPLSGRTNGAGPPSLKTGHFISSRGLAGPVKRYYTIFFICGLWFWLWDHRVNSAPTPLCSKNIGQSLVCHARAPDGRPVSDGIHLQGREGGGVARRASVRPRRSWGGCGASAAVGCVGVCVWGGTDAVTAPPETFSKHNQMNWSPICQPGPSGSQE